MLGTSERQRGRLTAARRRRTCAGGTETATARLTEGTVVLVRDVMVTDIVTVPVDASLDDAVARMLSERVGSVVVTRNESPTGILTETDVLKAAHATDASFDDVPAGAAMSSPLVTVSPDATVRSAVSRMAAEDVKRLPAVDGLELAGIVTMTDVVFNYSEFLREAQRIEAGRSGWSSGESVRRGRVSRDAERER